MHERRTSPRQWVAFVIFVLTITALIGVGLWLGFSSVFKSCCTTA